MQASPSAVETTGSGIEAPAGWVDLQVNGFLGVDFSAPGLRVDDVRRVTRELVRRGTGAYCPTVVTCALATYAENLPVLARAMAEPDLRPHLLGIHLEGPFLSPGASGAHPPEHLRAPEVALFDQWQHAAGGTIRLLTLAPELPGADALIRHAAGRGVVVSLGHHLADDAVLARAIDAGARVCTHIGNGIPNTLARHPNPIWSQLAADALAGMFITDGHHVPAAFVQVAWRAKGASRFVVTSDAAPVAGLPPGNYQCWGLPIISEPGGRIVRRDGNSLAGSSSSMAECIHWVRSVLPLAESDIERIGRTNALQLLAR